MTHTTPSTTDAEALHRRLLLGAAGLAGLAAFAAGRTSAGPLNPPAGAVTSTSKTLTDVEPRIAVNATNTPGTSECIYQISQPGSYYLTGNVIGVSGKRGIQIVSNNVTLDLNGFVIQGATGTGEGVLLFFNSPLNIVIRNGHIRDWGGSALNMQTSNAENCRVEDIIVTDNGGGITVYGHTVVRRCTVKGNTGAGISALTYCTIEDCLVRGNTGAGIAGGNAAQITRCTVAENGGGGITASILCVIADNSCLSNAGDGIRLGSRNRVTGNYLYSNAGGGQGGGGAGIHAEAAGLGGNHIEGNTSLNNDRGYHAQSTRNILMRNVAGGNTVANWDIATGNLGQVIFAALNVGFTGHSGGVPLGGTGYDPNANFTYF